MHVFWGMIKLEQLKGFYYINSFSPNIFGPNQKPGPGRSVQLEAVYLEALLYRGFSPYANFIIANF